MIKRLQALRLVAAALVLVGHVLMELDQHHLRSGAWSALGLVPWGIGVDIFFVISGFIITESSIDRPASVNSAIDFLVHRVIRLWPVYALFTLLMLVAMILVPRFLEHPHIQLGHVLASFAFVPWPRPGDGRYYPVLGQGWTLNYEMFFYVSFGIALLLPLRRRVPVLLAGGALLVVAGRLLYLPQPLAFYSQPIIMEFLAGMLLCLGYRRWSGRTLLGALTIFAAAVYLVVFRVDTEVGTRALFAGAPAFLLVAGVLLLGDQGERFLGRRTLVLLGNASYALYLSHTFVVNGVLWMLLKIEDRPAPAMVMFIAVTLSLVVSVIIYVFFEKPILSLLRPKYQSLQRRSSGLIASLRA